MRPAGGAGWMRAPSSNYEASAHADGLTPPEAAHRGQHLVEPEHPLARARPLQAEALVVRAVADRDQELQAAGCDPLSGGGRLCEVRGVPVVDQPHRSDLDPLGSREQRDRHRPAVEYVGLARSAEHRDVAVHERGRVAERFSGFDQFCEGLPRVAVPAECDAELHASLPSCRAAWISAIALFASVSSPRQIRSSASSSEMRNASMISSSSGRESAASRSKPA